MTIYPIITHKYGTALQWTTANPILDQAEIGAEIDTYRIKVGDGTTAWNSLPYVGGSALTAEQQRVAAEIFNKQTAVTSGTDRTPFAGKIFIADPAIVGSTGADIEGASEGDIWLW